MAKGKTKRVAFIASYVPRKCGIATFTSDLIQSVLNVTPGEFDPLVVALRASPEDRYRDPVKLEIRQNVKGDYISAADFLNFSHIDVVVVQHEFGLFGGDAGAYLSLLLHRLKAPIVSILHTILEDPPDTYRKAMEDLCRCSHQVITMNVRGIDMLRGIYAVPSEKITLIPHGIPDLPFVDSNYYKHKFDLESHRTILTFGLLSKNKGIETMLQAMPAIVAVDPSVKYIVLGMTHPNVIKHEGESYRFSLQQMVKDLHLENHVIFYNRFVDTEELHNFLCAADIYVTPYLSVAQLTSGTLSFAVGTGKAVVSTPYWAAEELLAEGRGRLVPFGETEPMSQAIIKILQDDLIFYSMRRRAYDYGRTRTWTALGQQYWDLFNRIEVPQLRGLSDSYIDMGGVSHVELPDPCLDHIIRLSDDTGLFQHARYTLPHRADGYCTDDNARGVILMARYYAEYPTTQALHLLDTYLSFTLHAQEPNGIFRNFMNFDRTWVAGEPVNDAFGRVLWALGALMTLAPAPSYISVLKEHFDRSIHLITKQYPRGMAYCILGMCDYLRQFPGASEIKRELELTAEGLVHQYHENRDQDWFWFEDALTYDNGVLPHALFAAGKTLDHAPYLEIAQQTCDFLVAQTFNGKYFSLIGNKGWYEQHAERAIFDQQPIDAASLVLMLRAAYDATGDSQYLVLQRKAFDWFLGTNDVGIPLYDFRTTGCYDGLIPGGVNINQGAESTLSFMMSLLEVMDSFALLDKWNSNQGRPPLPTALLVPIIEASTGSRHSVRRTEKAH